MSENEIKEKMCSKCMTRKLISEFALDKNGVFGVRSVCKVCAAEKAREYRAKNPEKISEKRKETYQEQKETISEVRKEYYQENKDKISEKRHQYYQEHKEEINARNRKSHEEHKDARNAQKRVYYRENIDERRAHAAEYEANHKDLRRSWNQSLLGKWSAYKTTAKRRKIDFELPLEQFSSFWQKPCHYCGCPVETICLDRIDSSLGYTMDNVVPSCVTHNIMKQDSSIEEFVAACRAVVIHFDSKEKEE